MFKSKDPQEFADRMRELFEKSPAKDVEKNLREFAAAAMSKANLVTREEFNAQSEALSKALAKMEALEEQVKKLAENRPPETGPKAKEEPKGKGNSGDSGPKNAD